MADSVYTGAKWGASAAFGSPGGVVSWSFNVAGAQFYAFDAPIVTVAYQTAIRTAFDLWESLTNIDFVEVLSPMAAIQVGWDTFDGPRGTLGQATWQSRSSQITQAEIAFDIAETWGMSAGQPTYFFAVAVHEIGHAIGLDHTDDRSSIMYPLLGSHSRPSAEDVAAIHALYGPPGASVAGGVSLNGILTGSAGDDWLTAEAVDTTVLGGGGADTISARPEAGTLLTIFGGGGAGDPNDTGDTIAVSGGGSAIVYGNGGDDYIDISALRGSTVYGGVGDDTVRVQNDGENLLHGGSGGDVIVVTGNGDNAVFGAQFPGDPLDGADRIEIYGNGDNVIYGNGGDDRVAIVGLGNNTVYGGLGNDTIIGGGGSDLLVGGAGDNFYTGGGGADRFLISVGAADFITDFRFEEGDRLDLQGRSFVLGQNNEGQAALFLDGGGTVVLLGLNPSQFQSNFLI